MAKRAQSGPKLGTRRTPLHRTDKAHKAVAAAFRRLHATVTDCSQGHFGAGHPDLVVQVRGRAAGVEVKTPGAKHGLTLEQVKWAIDAQVRGNEWFVATCAEDAVAIVQYLGGHGPKHELYEPYKSQYQSLSRQLPWR